MVTKRIERVNHIYASIVLIRVSRLHALYKGINQSYYLHCFALFGMINRLNNQPTEVQRMKTVIEVRYLCDKDLYKVYVNHQYICCGELRFMESIARRLYRSIPDSLLNTCN
jgi:hypothetical protein